MGIKIGSVEQKLGGINSEDAFYTKFTSSGSDDMRVDGSVTPVEFTLEALPAGRKVLLQMLSFLIGTGTPARLDEFGDIVALTNGILFTSGDNELTIKDNGDTLLVATSTNLESSGTGTNTYTIINGVWDFTDSYGGGAPVLVNADTLKIIIRDDLTTIPFFKVSCHGILLENN